MCFAKVLWRESPRLLNIDMFSHNSLVEWVQHILHPHQSFGILLEEQHLFQIFVVNAMDWLWLNRSRQVRHNSKYGVVELASHARRLSLEPWEAWKVKDSEG